ncbi:MAG: C40 family peptidase [Chitinophagaceae bacterium]
MLKSVQTPPGQASSSFNSRNSDKLTFINDIAIKRNGHITTQKVKGYSSPLSSPSSAAVAGATAALSVQQKYAQMLGVSNTDIDIDDSSLYSFIESWYGAPYLYGGDSRSGIDCSAFVQLLFGAVFGITSLPRTADEQYKDSKRIRHISKLKEGDLVFFRIHSRRVNHVGVYLQNDKFVNASASSGVTISDLTDPYWQRYFAGGGEPKQALDSSGFASSE